jgi:hypothetical protein
MNDSERRNHSAGGNRKSTRVKREIKYDHETVRIY